MHDKPRGLMTREIAIGDIHGQLDMLLNLWSELNFNPGFDDIIFLGDYIDRGPKSRECLAFVKDLREKYPDNITLLMGNHEDMAIKALGFQAGYNWRGAWMIPQNGGPATIASFGSEAAAKKALNDIRPLMKVWHQTDNAIYVHGSIPEGAFALSITEKGKRLVENNLNPSSLLWGREYYWPGDGTGRPVICGHTPVQMPEQRGVHTLIDTGATFGNRLTAYDVLNDKFYSVSS